MIRHIYRENGERKVIEFPYKFNGKGIDYKQLDSYYQWCKENKHTEFLGLFFHKD